MPAAKLRFTALVSETCRLIARVVRRAWMLLLPVQAVSVLLLLAAFGPGSGVVASVPGKVAVSVASAVAGWLLALVFARAALSARTGPDLLRIDRPALMLLGLDLLGLAVGNLPVPHWPAAQLLRSVLTLPAMLIWERMTLLLSVAWALGEDRMPIAESWRGLRGNFLRILIFGAPGCCSSPWSCLPVPFSRREASAIRCRHRERCRSRSWRSWPD